MEIETETVIGTGKFLAFFPAAFMAKTIALSTSFVFLSSCATRMFNAKKLQTAGMYEESLKMYEEELEESPDNIDAKIGVRSIRTDMMRKELVSIRLMRISGNTKNSAERLEKFLYETRDWDRTGYSSADVTSEQEEVAKGRAWLSLSVEKLLSENKPLLAENMLYKFRNLSSSVSSQGQMTSMAERIRHVGGEHCKKLTGELGEFSFEYSMVVKNYCRYFGVSTQLKTLDLSKDFKFSSIDVSGNIRSRDGNNLKEDFNEGLMSHLNSQLRKTDMYRENSSVKMRVIVKGEFIYDFNNDVVEKSHSYTEDVPYEAIEDYYDTEFTTVYEPQLVPVTLPNGMLTFETDVRPTSVPRRVLRSRVVTRYKTVPQSYRYMAVRNNQNFRLAVHLEDKVTKQVISKTYSDSAEYDTHTENMPHIGLNPSSETGIDIASWLIDSLEKIGTEFIESVERSQGNSFCSVENRNQDSRWKTERICRCALFDPENITVRTWFISTFGLDRESFLERIQQNDS